MRICTLLLVLAAVSAVMLPRSARLQSRSVEPPADLVVLGANVITLADGGGRAEAFAVRDGRFVAVGTTRAASALIGPRTAVWRLAGKTITPGFNDAHLHPAPAYAEDAPQYVVPLGPDHVHGIAELIAALRKKALNTPKGQTVFGFGYQETKLGRQPTCHDLDAASTEHPIVIRHASGHVSVCNSYALKAAGITRSTPDPAGGAIGHDADGEPNGYLAESAARLVANVGALAPAPDPNELLRAYSVCFETYASRGITSAGVAGTTRRTLESFQALRDCGMLPVRLNVMLREADIPVLADWVKGRKPSDDMVRVGTVKIFHGNSLSGRTCWVSEPYADRPGYFGIQPARSQQELDDLVWRIHHAGLQVACHSNGDREIDMVLTAIERAQAREPRPDARHRIEHCSVVTQSLLDRIKAAHVVVVPHSYEWEHGDKIESYGEKRWEWMFPSRRCMAMGIPVAGHSDSPVSAADPLLRIQCLVTRRSAEGKVYGAAQVVSPTDALREWTTGGAYATFEEQKKGRIAVGMLADFVVLGGDPTRTAANAIKDIRVERTVVGGRTVYDRTRDQARLSALAPGWYHLCGDGDEAAQDDDWPPHHDYTAPRR